MVNRCRIYGDIIVGILGIDGEAWAVVAIAFAGALPWESYLIIIPTFVIALLLIGSSVLRCQEG
jgi:hypothetical protein